MAQYVHTLQAKVETREKVPVQGGGFGFTTRHTGEKSGEVEVYIDWNQLRRYAEKALRSKSGKSVLACGAITFKVKRGSVVHTPANPTTRG